MTDYSELAARLKDVERLTEQAMWAVRLYHELRDSSGDPEQVEQLRQHAEFLMKALSDFQLQVLGWAHPSLQWAG